MNQKAIIIGAGAAGFMAAVNLAKWRPELQVILLEQSNKMLAKVKISGGGRCNVTNVCEVPKDLVLNYPRGQKELLGPFHMFNTTHTRQWFLERGVKLKVEKDGRVFPVSDSSQTIIDCFLSEAEKYHVKIVTQQKIVEINRNENVFEIKTDNQTWQASYLLIATGSNTSAWKWIAKLGHQIIDPVPSLFTFSISDNLLEGLSGQSFRSVQARFSFQKKYIQGDMLITHWGLSGPLILKLSAWYARELFQENYKAKLIINFINKTTLECLEELISYKNLHPKKHVSNTIIYEVSSRFWVRCLELCDIKNDMNWSDCKNSNLQKLAVILTQKEFQMTGKATFKDEFVTAGGVNLKEIDMKTMQSKLIPNLYFAGEVLNIDAVTGGFNFQAAWTTAFLAAQSIAEKCEAQ